MNQPINSISSYLKNHFGQKTVKLSIDGGFTCPNRDGTKGYGGCLFCSEDGSGEFASNIEDQIELLSEKWPNANYLAYFQNHTNTYAPVSELREKYEKALSHPLNSQPSLVGFTGAVAPLPFSTVSVFKTLSSQSIKVTVYSVTFPMV